MVTELVPRFLAVGMPKNYKNMFYSIKNLTISFISVYLQNLAFLFKRLKYKLKKYYIKINSQFKVI